MRTTYDCEDTISVAQDFGGQGGDERYLYTAPIGADGLSGLKPVKKIGGLTFLYRNTENGLTCQSFCDREPRSGMEFLSG